jgi:hypothetical protein
MNPFQEAGAWQLTEAFYRKFYSDREPRIFLFGINPGRFGGGITGIPFTDPRRLEEDCGIANPLNKRSELSSVFIYAMIRRFGGAAAFYSRFLISAVSPLGFVKGGKNLNYYDDIRLQHSMEPFIIQSLETQVRTMGSAEYCYCLGEGKNAGYFNGLNEKHRFFRKIIALPHPRWIMQYRRKRMEEFIGTYLHALRPSIPG